MMPKKLTPKQKRFCQEYVVDFNATKAAERAGYSKNRSKEIGYQLLHKTTLQEEISKLIKKLDDRSDKKARELIKSLHEISDFDMKDLLTWDTKLVKIGTDKDTGEDIYDYRPVVEIKPPDQVDGKMIAEISLSSRGTLTVKTHDKLSAKDKLMKYHGLYEKDNEQSRVNMQVVVDNAVRRSEELAEKYVKSDNNKTDKNLNN